MKYFAMFLMLLSMVVCTVGCEPAAETPSDTEAVETPAEGTETPTTDDAGTPAADDDDAAPAEPTPEPPVE